MPSDPLPAQLAEQVLITSIRDWTGRAARMLARDPQIATYDFRTAVVLGDAARVRTPGSSASRPAYLSTHSSPRRRSLRWPVH